MQRPSADFVNEHYPIVAVRFYPNGAEIVRRGETAILRSRGKRNHIEELSQKSLCKLAFTGQNLNCQLLSMLCLTCGDIYPRDGIVFKEALNRVLSSLRYRYKPFEYLWFLEFQKRGAPHIHVLTNVRDPSAPDRRWLAKTWAKSLLSHSLRLREYDEDALAKSERKLIRQHRRLKVWEAIRKENGATRYITKYATKTQQKTVPADFARVGRFWGVSSGAKPRPLSTNGASELGMRIHLANKNHPVAEYSVLPKLVWFRDGNESD